MPFIIFGIYIYTHMPFDDRPTRTVTSTVLSNGTGGVLKVRKHTVSIPNLNGADGRVHMCQSSTGCANNLLVGGCVVCLSLGERPCQAASWCNERWQDPNCGS